ncbi:MAG: hypothetical protein MUC36_13895 [Planctomycetes bacterium]|jgi:hypothetical protein|nr:hypothetical protein [Planctomycetota bacterium]
MHDRPDGPARFDRIRLRARMARHRRWRSGVVDPAVYYEDPADRFEAHATLRQLLQALDPEAGHDAERIELVVRSGARVTRGQEQRLVARDGRGFLQLTSDSGSRWGRCQIALLAAGRAAWDLEFLFDAGGDRLLVPWSVSRGCSDAAPGQQLFGAGVCRDELEALGALVVARQTEAAVRGPARHEVEVAGLGPVFIEARDGGQVSVLQLLQQSVELARRPAAACARYRGTFAAGTLRMQLQRRSGESWWCRCAEVHDAAAGDVRRWWGR